VSQSRTVSRERRVRRSRIVDALLEVALLPLMPVLLHFGMPFGRTLAVLIAVTALLYGPLALYQYRALDEYDRGRWLRSIALSGLVTQLLLLLVMAWGLWQHVNVTPQLLGMVFALAWLSSWATWFALRWRDGREPSP
jgi:hypothetical protein